MICDKLMILIFNQLIVGSTSLWVVHGGFNKLMIGGSEANDGGGLRDS